jgi:N-acetylneuraminic acid mutarotase
MIVWGGTTNHAAGSELGDGAKYDPVTDSWSPVSSQMAPTARSDHTAIWTGREMVVWGGLTGGYAVNSGGSYDPVSDTWTDVPTTGAPLPRWQHAAVWSGSEMIVWGGADDTGSQFGDGARLGF